MVKNITLRLDDKMFRKMKEHKANLEAKHNTSMTWEEYTKFIFRLQ